MESDPSVSYRLLGRAPRGRSDEHSTITDVLRVAGVLATALLTRRRR